MPSRESIERTAHRLQHRVCGRLSAETTTPGASQTGLSTRTALYSCLSISAQVGLQSRRERECQWALGKKVRARGNAYASKKSDTVPLFGRATIRAQSYKGNGLILSPSARRCAPVERLQFAHFISGNCCKPFASCIVVPLSPDRAYLAYFLLQSLSTSWVVCAMFR